MNEVIQLSVFIPNEAGRVSEVTRILGEAEINIRGFSVSDTPEYGMLRLIVNKPVEAAHLLRDAGFTVRDTSVIIVDLPDQPGGLASILRIVSEAGVNIEYVYSLIGTYVVLNVADTGRAVSLLKDSPVRMVSQEEIAVA